jgi:hypothetical protein
VRVCESKSRLTRLSDFGRYVHGKVQERTIGYFFSPMLCNWQVKHREGLSKCLSDVLTVNLAEKTLTPKGSLYMGNRVFVLDAEKKPLMALLLNPRPLPRLRITRGSFASR